MLGSTYEVLGILEARVARGYPGVAGAAPENRRFFQAVAAYHQAIIIEPNDPDTLQNLIGLYVRMQKRDLALREIDRFAELSDQNVTLGDGLAAAKDQHETISLEFADTIDRVEVEIERRLEAGENPLGVAMLAYRAGCVLKALSVMEGIDQLAVQDLDAQRWHALFLLEAGRSEEAYVKVGQLEGAARQTWYNQWRNPAALVSLTNAN